MVINENIETFSLNIYIFIVKYIIYYYIYWFSTKKIVRKKLSDENISTSTSTSTTCRKESSILLIFMNSYMNVSYIARSTSMSFFLFLYRLFIVIFSENCYRHTFTAPPVLAWKVVSNCELEHFVFIHARIRIQYMHSCEFKVCYAIHSWTRISI